MSIFNNTNFEIKINNSIHNMSLDIWNYKKGLRLFAWVASFVKLKSSDFEFSAEEYSAHYKISTILKQQRSKLQETG